MGHFWRESDRVNDEQVVGIKICNGLKCINDPGEVLIIRVFYFVSEMNLLGMIVFILVDICGY